MCAVAYNPLFHVYSSKWPPNGEQTGVPAQQLCATMPQSQKPGGRKSRGKSCRAETRREGRRDFCFFFCAFPPGAGQSCDGLRLKRGAGRKDNIDGGNSRRFYRIVKKQCHECSEVGAEHSNCFEFIPTSSRSCAPEYFTCCPTCMCQQKKNIFFRKRVPLFISGGLAK